MRVGELLPHLQNVASDSSVGRTRYTADCPACDQPTFSFSQTRHGIGFMCSDGCSLADIASIIVKRRLAAGEHPEDLWGRAERALKGEKWWNS